MAKKQANGMWVGEEVMTILMELASLNGFTFTWRTALEAYSSVYGKHYWDGGKRKLNDPIFKYLKEKRYIHMTLGNLLRGQLKGGTLRRLDKGIYVFRNLRISRPLFCVAGNYSGTYKHGRSDIHPFADIEAADNRWEAQWAARNGHPVGTPRPRI